MTTSMTWDFNLDIADAIEEAYERVGLESRTGYDYRTARRSLDMLLLEWQNRGLNLWTVKNATLQLNAGQIAYDLDPERFDIVEMSRRTSDGGGGICAAQEPDLDIHMRRISISNYARISRKGMPGAPIQYWVERTPDYITINVWPAPDSRETYYINYYYMQRVEDTGKPGTNVMDLPARFLPVVTAGLAYYIAVKKAPEKAALLKQLYDEQWKIASDSERNKANFFFRPGGYARV